MKICPFLGAKANRHCHRCYLEKGEMSSEWGTRMSMRWLSHLLASFTTAGWMKKKQEVREKNSECIHRRTWPLLNLKHRRMEVNALASAPAHPDVTGALPGSQRCRARQAADARQHTQGPRQVGAPQRHWAEPSPLLDTRQRLFSLSLWSRPRSSLGSGFLPLTPTSAPLQNLPHINAEYISPGRD